MILSPAATSSWDTLMRFLFYNLSIWYNILRYRYIAMYTCFYFQIMTFWLFGNHLFGKYVCQNLHIVRFCQHCFIDTIYIYIQYTFKGNCYRDYVAFYGKSLPIFVSQLCKLKMDPVGWAGSLTSSHSLEISGLHFSCQESMISFLWCSILNVGKLYRRVIVWETIRKSWWTESCNSWDAQSYDTTLIFEISFLFTSARKKAK